VLVAVAEVQDVARVVGPAEVRADQADHDTLAVEARRIGFADRLGTADRIVA
jgi:hypothetical protein